MSKTAKLDLGETTLELPIIEGTEGEKALDISQLRAQTGFITMDPGFGNTGSCQSKITFLDGEKGILKHRGFTVEELCEKSNFLEVAMLLQDGKLPNSEELNTYRDLLNQKTAIPKGICELIESFPKDAHPMGVLSAATVALSAYYPELLKPKLDEKEMADAIAQVMAQIPLMAAHFYRHSQGMPAVASNSNYTYCKDFLNLLFHKDGYEPNDNIAKALDVLFILHADHEQNCSASSVRVTGSGQANLFATICAGINALWGPLHGGANQAVIEMLDAIQADGGDYEKFLAKAKDKNDPFRLMGFGHRVYKNFDPRARIIKSYCDEVLTTLGVNDPVLDIAKGLEEAALNDSYFAERKLYPNVDFYSGIIYRAMGIPTNMFTVMFVLGRVPGWIAQWKEMISNPKARISRPRQIYQGEVNSTWVDLADRK